MINFGPSKKSSLQLCSVGRNLNIQDWLIMIFMRMINIQRKKKRFDSPENLAWKGGNLSQRGLESLDPPDERRNCSLIGRRVRRFQHQCPKHHLLIRPSLNMINWNYQFNFWKEFCY